MRDAAKSNDLTAFLLRESPLIRSQSGIWAHPIVYFDFDILRQRSYILLL